LSGFVPVGGSCFVGVVRGEARVFADDTLGKMRVRSQGLEMLLTDLFGSEAWKDSPVALSDAVRRLDLSADSVLVLGVVEEAAEMLAAARSLDRWLVSGGVKPTDW
jgi:hypothetical protein